MKGFSDKNIVSSWKSNAKPWIQAIDSNQIESRNLVTNKAIINTINQLPGKSILDIGCGEGWLLAELASLGLNASGLDVVPELLEKAKINTNAKLYMMDYEDITSQSFGHRFDIIVCNFSLIGNESVQHIFNIIPKLLNQGGHFVVQTLHPKASCGKAPYEDGWREGSWVGFNEYFCDPPPWYFRTIESWSTLFYEANLASIEMIEPVHPKTEELVSIIIKATLI
jgi:2-polyprenyl-3-methyl-5-hydroxy-6-metoxy-1,4-benzoquinol methylase